MKVYDVYVQCAKCKGECHIGFISTEKPEVGSPTYRCARCAEEYEELTGLAYDDFIVSEVEVNESYADRESLIEWYRDFKPYNGELVDQYFDWDEENEQHIPNGEIEVVSITLFATPPWEWPQREWFTVAEIADMHKTKGREGVKNDFKRGHFDKFKEQGYVQYSGATILVHKHALNEVYGDYCRPLIKPIETEKKYTVCVDLNGVIDTYSGWKGNDHVDPAREGAKEFLEELSKRYRVVIFTTQPAPKVWEWLKEYSLDGYVTEVTDRKPPALFYIDDRAVMFKGNYEETLQEIKSFKPHWRK
jgi:hypothetical protein